MVASVVVASVVESVVAVEVGSVSVVVSVATVVVGGADVAGVVVLTPETLRSGCVAVDAVEDSRLVVAPGGDDEGVTASVVLRAAGTG